MPCNCECCEGSTENYPAIDTLECNEGVVAEVSEASKAASIAAVLTGAQAVMP